MVLARNPDSSYFDCSPWIHGQPVVHLMARMNLYTALSNEYNIFSVFAYVGGGEVTITYKLIFIQVESKLKLTLNFMLHCHPIQLVVLVPVGLLSLL